MKKTVTIEGMHCANCAARLEKMLNTAEGVSARVDFATKTACIESACEIPDGDLRGMIDFAGFRAVSIGG